MKILSADENINLMITLKNDRIVAAADKNLGNIFLSLDFFYVYYLSQINFQEPN